MAVFSCNDIDGLVLDMEELSRLNDDVITEMVEAGAKVVERAHKEAIRKNFSTRTGKLAGSPKAVIKTC